MATVFGFYRKTTASWAEGGIVTTIFEKIKGQGSDVLLETGDDTTPIILGDVYGLSLTVIASGTPVPPIELPEFPELPNNDLPEAPVYPDNSLPVPPGQVAPPIYLPGYPSHPIALPPGYPDNSLPVAPGTPSQPIYLPGYPSQPIYLPPTAGQLPVFPVAPGQLPVFPGGGYPGQLPVFPGTPGQLPVFPSGGYPSQPIYIPGYPSQPIYYPPTAGQLPSPVPPAAPDNSLPEDQPEVQPL
jgi:hypothetical protein